MVSSTAKEKQGCRLRLCMAGMDGASRLTLNYRFLWAIWWAVWSQASVSGEGGGRRLGQRWHPEKGSAGPRGP